MIENQTNKFMTNGQVLIHNPTGSKWIIVDTNPYDKKDNNMRYTRLVKAYCLYEGSKPDYWEVNQIDHWGLTDKDLEEHDKRWTIV